MLRPRRRRPRLAAIGQVLHAQARSSDVIGRLGGDEFAVIMPQDDSRAAVALAGRICEAVPAATEVPATLSIGVSGLEGSAPTTERMMDDADFALYWVKGAGRDGVAIHDTGSARPQRQPTIDAAPIPS